MKVDVPSSESCETCPSNIKLLIPGHPMVIQWSSWLMSSSDLLQVQFCPRGQWPVAPVPAWDRLGRASKISSDRHQTKLQEWMS